MQSWRQDSSDVGIEHFAIHGLGCFRISANPVSDVLDAIAEYFRQLLSRKQVKGDFRIRSLRGNKIGDRFRPLRRYVVKSRFQDFLEPSR
jgi:hypothetical protein